MITITEEEEEEEVIPNSTAEAATPPKPTTTTDKEATTSNRTATMIITSRTIQTPIITPLNTITLNIQSGTFLELQPPPTTVILIHLTTFSRHSSRRPSAT